ncbi:hypothetical protein IFR05_015569 [Cadophora sp. M221]|nr:hypothetical protein IFR05_015569 [Cadophora sp. M221]
MSRLFSRFRKTSKAPAPRPPPISQQDIAALPEFRYVDTLQQQCIRLIRLQDGEPDDRIQCTHETRALDKNPGYNALFYVWGDQNDTIPISCNGQRPQVTRNLHAAMGKMRMINYDRQHAPLWVDVVCIDQSNLDEKTEQIQLMGKIYAGASMIQIWLCDVPEESLQTYYEGVQMMKRIDSEIVRLLNSKEAELDDVAPHWVECYCKRHRIDPAIQWFKILPIIMSEWCNRVWVIQEFIHAKAVFVHLGPIVTQWEIIFRVAASVALRLPSWVADFTRNKLPTSQNYYPLSFTFGIPQLPQIKKQYNIQFGSYESLKVRAMQLDEVQQIVARNPYKCPLAMILSPESYDESAKLMAEWIAAVIATASGGRCAGFYERAHNLAPLHPLYVKGEQDRPDRPRDHEEGRKDRVAAQAYIQTFDTYSKGRFFCITKRGYLAWMPEMAQVGDLIYILQCCRVPYVLRPQGNSFNLIGDSYLHEHMSPDVFIPLFQSAKHISIV